jgi:hypothetical protein
MEPVDAEVTITATPGRLPPLGSVMVPMMRDSVCCADAVRLPTSKATTASTNTTVLLCTFTLPGDVRRCGAGWYSNIPRRYRGAVIRVLRVCYVTVNSRPAPVRVTTMQTRRVESVKSEVDLLRFLAGGVSDVQIDPARSAILR